MLKTVEIMMCS